MGKKTKKSKQNKTQSGRSAQTKPKSNNQDKAIAASQSGIKDKNGATIKSGEAKKSGSAIDPDKKNKNNIASKSGSKIKGGNAETKDKPVNVPVSAFVVMALFILSLVLLKIETTPDTVPGGKTTKETVASPAGASDKPGDSLKNGSANSGNPKTNDRKETSQTVSSDILDQINNGNEQLKLVVNALKKIPFKARITTEAGFKGYWTQNEGSYRFEDPFKSQAIIFNADKHRLWVVDLKQKVAYETRFNETSANAYADLSPAMFLETLAETTGTATKKLEDILPTGSKANLTLTNVGLPKRWEGPRKDGATAFFEWDYTQVAEVSPLEFELPSGVTIKHLSSTELSGGR